MKRVELKPGDPKEQFITLDYKKKHAKGCFWTLFFQDHEFQIAYIPSLNLSAYGRTEQEALNMLYNQVVDDFFTSLFTLTESGISDELKRYGWKKSLLRRKRFMDPPFVDKEGVLKNFNLPAETPVKEQLVGV